MPVGIVKSCLIILVAAGATFATRALPFLIFPEDRQIPRTVEYLGKVLTPAIIGILVIYCLKDTPILTGNHGVPEILSVAAVAFLHRWKRNNLLSIGGGTLLYMFMIQTVF